MNDFRSRQRIAKPDIYAGKNMNNPAEDRGDRANIADELDEIVANHRWSALPAIVARLRQTTGENISSLIRLETLKIAYSAVIAERDQLRADLAAAHEDHIVGRNDMVGCCRSAVAAARTRWRACGDSVAQEEAAEVRRLRERLWEVEVEAKGWQKESEEQELDLIKADKQLAALRELLRELEARDGAIDSHKNISTISHL